MNKKTKSQQGKKRQTRNILIAVAAALVIAVAIFLIVALSPDAAGMNCFQRKATVASADGEKITMGEYRVTYYPTSRYYAQLYQAYGITAGEAAVKELQENAAKEALLQKIYIKEGKAAGFTLTKEEEDACKKNAQDYVNGIDEQLKQEMIEGGAYSKAAFDKQVVEYYRALGMNKNEYFNYMKRAAEAALYADKLMTYWNEKNAPDDETLLQYYRENAIASMSVKKSDGTETPNYTEGQIWTSYEMFRTGQSVPMPYLPEGFIFIDFVQIEAASSVDAEEIVRKIESGETTFEELKSSPDNKDPFAGKLNGPYPIAENDHKQLFEDQEIYTKAAALNDGEIGTFIKTEGDKVESTATVYVFRRAKGDIFMDAESRVINIDYFTGLRETVKSEYINAKWADIQNGWLADVKFSDALYAYKGALG
jgi:hypothetical protein